MNPFTYLDLTINFDRTPVATLKIGDLSWEALEQAMEFFRSNGFTLTLW